VLYRILLSTNTLESAAIHPGEELIQARNTEDRLNNPNKEIETNFQGRRGDSVTEIDRRISDRFPTRDLPHVAQNIVNKEFHFDQMDSFFDRVLGPGDFAKDYIDESITEDNDGKQQSKMTAEVYGRRSYLLCCSKSTRDSQDASMTS
jgi:hypothetical protein